MEIMVTQELKNYLYDLGLLLEDDMVERLLKVELHPSKWSIHVVVFGMDHAEVRQRWLEWTLNGEDPNGEYRTVDLLR